jgi:hypothetical protein
VPKVGFQLEEIQVVYVHRAIEDLVSGLFRLLSPGTLPSQHRGQEIFGLRVISSEIIMPILAEVNTS